MNKKVSVIGAGNVGSTCAQRIAQRGCADVVLLDIIEGMPQGKALDMMHSHPIVGSSINIIGTNSYEDTARSSVVVITSGSPRKPSGSRHGTADEVACRNRMNRVDHQLFALRFSAQISALFFCSQSILQLT